ncbi:receptor activity-modifying protein 1 isoform X2 [Anolis carolinensis]|uniref:receptor activity-modifying protein 1 isoform X2 n=1 Tax=Anolis carolinensis TaxID=28377 RepID=UPI002F2B29AD
MRGLGRGLDEEQLASGAAAGSPCSKLSFLFSSGCTEVTYSDLEDEKLFEEEDLAIDCRDTYYDSIALHCWPKFHFVFVATDESNQCLWETIGSIYGELALCTGLLAEGMGCPISSPTLDAFFVKIHNEYFANCSLPTSTFVTQPSIGTVTILTFLTVCLVPISVVLLLRKI